MGIQDLTLSMVLIVAVGVFLASFMDAIAGGGGIISVPTYLLAGLPMHVALGTNKLSAGLGSLASTGRYIKSGYVDWKLGVPSIVLALVGSHFGTKLQLMIDEVYLQYLLLVVRRSWPSSCCASGSCRSSAATSSPKSRWRSCTSPPSSSARTTASTVPAPGRSCCSFSAILPSSTCARQAATSSS